MIYKNIIELIGNTPLLEISTFTNNNNVNARILVKLENKNPGGSVKDRIAMAMILGAEEHGKINKDTVIIEPTSGNTGIGLAMVAASRGYKAILVMPDTLSIERRNLIKAYGAELILTKGIDGMKGAIEKSLEIAKEYPNHFIPSQFENPANPNIHIKTTGPEIWESTEGNIDIFVTGCGTGGTISGAGQYLKNRNRNIQVVAVEPVGSAVISGEKPGKHKIQGIGPGFIPKNLNTKIYDEVIQVNSDDAFNIGRELAKTEGLLVGISSGAHVFAALTLAKRPENRDKTIVTVIADTGERYLSTEMFNFETF